MYSEKILIKIKILESINLLLKKTKSARIQKFIPRDGHMAVVVVKWNVEKNCTFFEHYTLYSIYDDGGGVFIYYFLVLVDKWAVP